MMYRLLIVDDEEIITDSLYEVFSQLMPEDLDVCKAYSAKEALKWLSRTRIDIVLTDIRMPGMSGLELSEEIRQMWPRCRVIFLTGHSEFDYAYRAMQIPNIRYLLKTEGYGRIIDTVEEVIQEIRQGEKIDQMIAHSEERIGELEWLLHGDYFRHLIQHPHEITPESLENNFRKLNIRLEPDKPVALVLGHIEFANELDYTDRREMLRFVRYIWHQYLAERTQSVGIEDKYGDLLWFIQPVPGTGELKISEHLMSHVEGMLELIQQTAQESFGLSLTFTLSHSPCDWLDIPQQYEKLHLLQHFRFHGLPAIIKDRQEELTNQDELRLKNRVELLSSLLDSGKPDDFLTGFDELIKAVADVSATNAQLAIEIYYSLALALLSHINRWGLHAKIGDFSKLMRFDEHATLRDGFSYLRQIAARIFDLNRMDERDRATKIVDRICAYIVDHLGEDLSLVRLAELHYFNPSYLSRLFKQEKGVNLSEYIDHCRIKKAKELLGDRDLKVREVAAAVGYEAAHSFTRFFKKATGMTPQEYRDQLVEGGYNT